MSQLPSYCQAVVYDPDTGKLCLREFRLRPPLPGEILVRVSLSAICGSDLHTISGRRAPRVTSRGSPACTILGHEACGRIAALGEEAEIDSTGQKLSVGDRVTWSIAASCGKCFFCKGFWVGKSGFSEQSEEKGDNRGIPQKCESLFKYGHETIDTDPALSGGFSEYIYLVPGTAVYRITDSLDDDLVVFANCSLATMAAAVRLAEISQGESVLIQGAGLVGLCATALSAHRGAKVVAVDVLSERLSLAKKFGATHTFLLLCDQKGMLAGYNPKGIDKIKPGFKDETHKKAHWVGIKAWMTGFVGNTIEMKRLGLKMPKSFADLLKSEYSGYLVMPNPASSGTGFLTVSAILQLMGEERGWEYLDKLDKNIAIYTHSGSKPAKLAGKGEFSIGVSFAYRGFKQQSKGEPVIVTFPKEGSGWDLEANALIKKPRVKKNAKIFLDWAISEDVMKMYSKVYPIVSMQMEVEVPDGSSGLSLYKYGEGNRVISENKV